MCFRFHRHALCATTLMLVLNSGCAALSLFDQTHTHHHHYDCDSSDVANRLESLERRFAQLDRASHGGVTYSTHEVPRELPE